MFAISKALQSIDINRYNNKKVIIFANSCVIRALENCFSVNKLIQQILSQFRELTNYGIIIEFSDNIMATNENGISISKQLSKAGSIAHRSIDYDSIPVS